MQVRLRRNAATQVEMGTTAVTTQECDSGQSWAGRKQFMRWRWWTTRRRLRHKRKAEEMEETIDNATDNADEKDVVAANDPEDVVPLKSPISKLVEQAEWIEDGTSPVQSAVFDDRPTASKEIQIKTDN